MTESEARKLLGLEEGPVTLTMLRAARNDALKVHHPDKAGSDAAAVRRATYWTTQINAAHDVILRTLSSHGDPGNSGSPSGASGQSFAGAARVAQERAAQEQAAQERAAREQVASQERAAARERRQPDRGG